MNQGRIWCVVHPTVGLPLLLGSVAVTSLVVHASILTHTNWMSSYWAGKDKSKVALEGGVAPVALLGQNGQPAFVITVAPASGAAAGQAPSFVVTMAPQAAKTVGETADRAPEKLADAAPPLK